MRLAKVVLASCVLLLATSCHRQYEHFIRVSPPEQQQFTASDCEAFTALVESVASSRGLEEEGNVPDEELGHSYKEYWAEESPVSIALFCGSGMLQVKVTALAAHPAGFAREKAYRDSISELASSLEEQYGPRMSQWEDSAFVRSE